MENSDFRKNYRADEVSTLPKSTTDLYLHLFPSVYYLVNRILEDCTPQFSKKVGVALWALSTSAKADKLGPYLTTSDLVKTFRAWFAKSESNASTEVSRVKNDLLTKCLIKVEGGPDHIHLNDAGDEVVRQMMDTARGIIGEITNVLSPDEALVFYKLAKKVIDARSNSVNDPLQLDLPT